MTNEKEVAKMTQFSKRAIIIIIWLVFLVIINFVFFTVENRNCYEEASDELSDLSVTVAGQIPVITENDYYTRKSSSDMEYAKLKALSLALGQIEDTAEQLTFLKQFEQVSNIEGLVVYNRDADLVYSSGAVSGVQMDAETIRSALDSQNAGQADQSLPITEQDRARYLSSAYLSDNKEGTFTWKANGSKWLLVSVQQRTDDENQLIDYFSWPNVLSKISIGRTGFVLAFDNEDGTVLSCPDLERVGSSVEAMEIRIGDNNSSAVLSDLEDAFKSPNQIVSVRIGEKKYYANRLNENHCLMLALMPEDEIRENVVSSSGMFFTLIFLISGICVLFAFFHIQDTEGFTRRPRGRFAWNGVLAGRLKIMFILICIVLIASGFYLEALSAYAGTFRYTSNKVDGVVDLVKSNNSAEKLLQNWFRDEYLAKCRVIRCILAHTPQENRTREYLSELSEKLNIRSVCIYDSDGNVRLTDSPYSHDSLPKADPFSSLLKGRSELVGELEQDTYSGESRQRAGIPLLNEKNECIGLIMIVTDPSALEKIRENLGFGGVYEQISLKDESFVMVIRSSDLTIEYLAEVNDGLHRVGMDLFDYTGYPISEMGISETELRDHYNGNLFVLHDQYFASVRRMDDFYLLVMRPQIRFNTDYLDTVIIAVSCTLLFAVALILFSCLEKQETAIRQERLSAGAAANAGHEDEATDELKRRDDDVFAMLGNLIDKKKPFFEQRWPEDCVKWKDKTTDEKFKTSLRYILIFTLAVILVRTLAAGESSVWYYCFSGQWNTGINLYSLTNCLISICWLFVIKLVMHKLLFLTARAVKARAETLCHLLDSFSGYCLAIVGIFICLSHLGVGATTLSLTGGVAGVIFGIGCQNIVADILAGILMVFEGVVSVGDFVSFNGQYGVVLSIGVRTTKLKWFSETTIIRNNDFKNFINMPSDKEDRVLTYLSIDLKESLSRVEEILKEELPAIHDRLCLLAGEEVRGPKYRGVKQITENGVVLSFSIFCSGMYYAWLSRALNRELKLMCERNGINIAMQQVVINTPKDYPDLAVGKPEQEKD